MGPDSLGKDAVCGSKYKSFDDQAKMKFSFQNLNLECSNVT